MLVERSLHALYIGLISVTLPLLLTFTASAHEVSLQAEVSVQTSSGNNTYSASNVPRSANIASVRVTARYSTGEAMAKGQIQIFAPGNSSIAWRTGVLNAQGEYTFSPDLSQRGRWTIRVESEGHTNFINLVI